MEGSVDDGKEGGDGGVGCRDWPHRKALNDMFVDAAQKNDNNIMQTAGMKHAEGSISIHVGIQFIGKTNTGISLSYTAYFERNSSPE